MGVACPVGFLSSHILSTLQPLSLSLKPDRSLSASSSAKEALCACLALDGWDLKARHILNIYACLATILLLAQVRQHPSGVAIQPILQGGLHILQGRLLTTVSSEGSTAWRNGCEVVEFEVD